jgi:hypothetical protein
MRRNIRKIQRELRDPQRDKSQPFQNDDFLEAKLKECKAEYLNLIED